MKRFIAASKNKGKIKEIKEILKDMPFEVVSMGEYGINNDIKEDGETFEENAYIKAKEIFNATKQFVMADDSGLEVSFLNGAPGIYTARFAGENASDSDKINKLLGLLEGVPFEKRGARFVCAVAVFLPNGEYFMVRGVCEGYIALEPKGDNGFGYDPIFYIPEYNMTSAQLEPEKKHKISHRGKALNLMLGELKKRLKNFNYVEKLDA